MATIKEYISKGQTKYKVRVLVGRYEITGKQKINTKQGLKSKKEARLAILALESNINSTPVKTSFNTSVISSDSNITFEKVYQEWFELYCNTVKESTWIKAKEISGYTIKTSGITTQLVLSNSRNEMLQPIKPTLWLNTLLKNAI